MSIILIFIKMLAGLFIIIRRNMIGFFIFFELYSYFLLKIVKQYEYKGCECKSKEKYMCTCFPLHINILREISIDGNSPNGAIDNLHEPLLGIGIYASTFSGIFIKV